MTRRTSTVDQVDLLPRWTGVARPYEMVTSGPVTLRSDSGQHSMFARIPDEVRPGSTGYGKAAARQPLSYRFRYFPLNRVIFVGSPGGLRHRRSPSRPVTMTAAEGTVMSRKHVFAQLSARRWPPAMPVDIPTFAWSSASKKSCWFEGWLTPSRQRLRPQRMSVARHPQDTAKVCCDRFNGHDEARRFSARGSSAQNRIGDLPPGQPLKAAHHLKVGDSPKWASASGVVAGRAAAHQPVDIRSPSQFRGPGPKMASTPRRSGPCRPKQARHHRLDRGINMHKAGNRYSQYQQHPLAHPTGGDTVAQHASERS